MKKIAYYFSLPFLYFFSILPFPFLYAFSSVVVFPLLYYVVKYRREVVYRNLTNSFPSKNSKELRKIEKDFYKYLGDLFVETIKNFTISKSELQRRLEVENIELMDELYAKGKSVVLTLGHYGNYEWLALSLGYLFKHKGCGPYRTMHNPYFNELFLQMRGKFGTDLFSTKETYKYLSKLEKEPIAIALANDQNAPPLKAFWTRFLNQDTSFFVGTEKIATQMDFAVVYVSINKTKRGKYTMRFELITENPQLESKGDIMKKHAQLLEASIKAKPSTWLWTHKRWKNPIPNGLKEGFASDLE